MSNQFTAKAFPVIGKAKKALIARGFDAVQAETILNAKGNTLGKRYSTACSLLRNPAA